MIEGDSGHVYPVFDNLRAGLTNSKYIQKYVKPNGVFYMSRWKMIKESGHFFNGKIKVVFNAEQKIESIHIDEEYLSSDKKDELERELLRVIQDAIFKVQKIASQKAKDMMGGMGLPGL